MAPIRPILILALLCSCGAPDTSGVRMVGHGGLGPKSAFPMDSREAVLSALELGLDGVELDVQLTKDSILVAFHDMELGGTTACSGLVNSVGWRELSTCQQGNAYPIVRLDSLLLEAAGQYPNAEFTMDIKLNTKGDWWPYLKAFAGAIGALHQRPELYGRLLVECQTADLLDHIRTRMPDLPQYLYCTEMTDCVEKAKELGCTGITVQADIIDPAEVSKAHSEGLHVTLFGIAGNWALRSALAKKPDRIQVDQ